MDIELSFSKLKADQIDVNYGKQHIIKALSLQFPEQQVTTIVGPNGCGKSTLLSTLARLHQPQQGTIWLNNQSLYQLKPRHVAQEIALLPQQLQVPEGLTVLELIRFGRQPHRHWYSQWSAQDETVISSVLAATDLTNLLDRPVSSLSGGQRQRAWLAMVMAQQTPILFLDEPTAALDLGHQIEVFELIRQLAANEKKTIVMVVHDLANACRYSDYLIAMQDGKILAQGVPQAVVTTQLVQQLYNIDCQLIMDPLTNSPVLTQLKRHQMGS